MQFILTTTFTWQFIQSTLFRWQFILCWKNLGHKFITGERRVLSGVYIENIPHWKLVSWSKISRLEFPALEINVKTSNLWPQYIFSEIFLLKQHFTSDSFVVCIAAIASPFSLLLYGSFVVLYFIFLVKNSEDQVKELGVLPIKTVSAIGTQTSVWIIFYQQDTEGISCGQEIRSVLNIHKGVLEKCSKDL